LEEVRAAEKDSIAVKLQKAKEEGILIGQKQQREAKDEEVQQMQELLNGHKTKYNKLEDEVKVLVNENTQLKLFKDKARTEIESLLNALKNEQEKQKQLSEELEALTLELNKHNIH